MLSTTDSQQVWCALLTCGVSMGEGKGESESKYQIKTIVRFSDTLLCVGLFGVGVCVHVNVYACTCACVPIIKGENTSTIFYITPAFCNTLVRYTHVNTLRAHPPTHPQTHTHTERMHIHAHPLHTGFRFAVESECYSWYIGSV